MAKKREVRIHSDFVENQKRVEKDRNPVYASNLDDTFYVGYIGKHYIGQSSTSPNQLLYRDDYGKGKKGV